MTDRELMQQALEALNRSDYLGWQLNIPIIKALRERLAQPEQEPVATLDDLEQEIYENTRQFVPRDVMEWMLKRYYTTPQRRKPLTDEEIESINVKFAGSRDLARLFARAIEAAHGIKEKP